MAVYRKYFGYVPSDEQNIDQENESEVEIENEQENEAYNRTGQNDVNLSRITQSAQNINVNAAGTGQAASITQASGADTNGTAQTQTNDQDPVNVAVPIQVNNADQAGNDLTD